MKKYVLKLAPYISETIWGGRKLIEDFNIKTEKANAAEAWMLSCHSAGPSTVINGEFSREPLPQVLKNNKEWCGKNVENFTDFPVLIKFIDAMDDLSVQVHPNKAYCDKIGSGQSKTECWYIIDCEEGAGLILGFKDEISPKQFCTVIEDGSLTDYVEFIEVKPGDFFFIESGTLHAICKGVLLAEVQQSSNTTYRIFDYNRVGSDGKPRELHVRDALEVTKLEKFTQPTFKSDSKGEKKLLADCPLFKVWNCEIDGEFNDFADEKSFVSLLIMSGEGTLCALDNEYSLNKGDSYFIPACSGDYTIKGNVKILETRI